MADDDARAAKRAKTEDLQPIVEAVLEHRYEHEQEPELEGEEDEDKTNVEAEAEVEQPGDGLQTVFVPDSATAGPEHEGDELHAPQTSDSDSSSDEGDDEDNLSEAQREIIKAMEDSLDDDREDVQRVRASNQLVTELRAFLYQHGPMDFLEKYAMDEECEYKPSLLLSVLGFSLPIELVERNDEDDFRMFLPVAIRHFSKARRRLPTPRTMDELHPILEQASNILVLTGAGISTSLGIPDFRSKHGLYAKLEHLGLSDPQEVFDIRLFREDPSIFYSVAKEILPAHDKYTPTHAFIKLLSDKGKLLRNYTQNIDNVEGNAGIPAEKLVQCHGSFATVTCQTCRYKADGESIYNELRSGTVAQCPLCAKLDRNDDDDDESFGIMKPDITFFGESLPDRFDDLLFGPEGDASKCDLVICIGTSLKVAPVSEIIRIVPMTVPQVYINRQGVKDNEFDITFAGGCDDVVEWVSERMQWELKHDMNQRLSGQYDWESFPGGKVVYDSELATYRFIQDSPE